MSDANEFVSKIMNDLATNPEEAYASGYALNDEMMDSMGVEAMAIMLGHAMRVPDEVPDDIESIGGEDPTCLLRLRTLDGTEHQLMLSVEQMHVLAMTYDEMMMQRKINECERTGGPPEELERLKNVFSTMSMAHHAIAKLEGGRQLHSWKDLDHGGTEEA